MISNQAAFETCAQFLKSCAFRAFVVKICLCRLFISIFFGTCARSVFYYFNFRARRAFEAYGRIYELNSKIMLMKLPGVSLEFIML